MYVIVLCHKYLCIVLTYISLNIGEEICGTGYFRCIHSYGCVLNTLVCNGEDDCGDGSDELGCKPSKSMLFLKILFLKDFILNFKDAIYMFIFYLSGTVAPLSCSPQEYMCVTGECINIGRLCDKKDDCPDGSDEKTCTDSGENLFINYC